MVGGPTCLNETKLSQQDDNNQFYQFYVKWRWEDMLSKKLVTVRFLFNEITARNNNFLISVPILYIYIYVCFNVRFLLSPLPTQSKYINTFFFPQLSFVILFDDQLVVSPKVNYYKKFFKQISLSSFLMTNWLFHTDQKQITFWKKIFTEVFFRHLVWWPIDCLTQIKSK